MKKIITLCFALSSLAFVSTSCGGDDDSSSNGVPDNCITCKSESKDGAEIVIIYCENEDGSLSVNDGEKTNEYVIAPKTFDEYIDELKAKGADCY